MKVSGRTVGAPEQVDLAGAGDGPTQQPATASGPSPSSVRRTLELLTLLAEADGSIAVRDVSRGLGLPPSSSHRLLAHLVDAGFAVADPETRRYSPGPSLYRLGALARVKADLAKIVQPFLDALTAECDETSLFAVFDRGAVSTSFIAKADSSFALSYRIELNTPVSPYWGSSSEVILAYLPEPDVQRVLAIAEPSPVGNLPPLPEEEFRARMANIRRRGFTVTRGVKLAGAIGTSAAVFDSEGVVGSVTITIPHVRFNRAMGPHIQKLVTDMGARISRALGSRTAT